MDERENYSGFKISTYQALRSHTDSFGQLSPPKGYGGIYIEGDEIKEIKSVKQIKGYLVLLPSTALKSLGSVRKIMGDFRMAAIQGTYVNDFDLGELEEVEGKVDLNQRVSDIKNLKIVRGKIKANNSRIFSFGNLIRVEGDIILNDILKGFVDNPSFFIDGKLRFWKRDYDIDLAEPTKIPSKFFHISEIPFWQNVKILSHREVLDTNEEVQFFYQLFKTNFLIGKPIDILSFLNYAYTLIFDLKAEFIEGSRSRKELIKYLSRIAFYYPKTKSVIQNEMRSLFKDSNLSFHSLNTLSEFLSGQKKFSLELLFDIDKGGKEDIILTEPELLIQLFTATDSPLTKLGLDKIDDVIHFFRKVILEEALGSQVISKNSILPRKSIWNVVLTKYGNQVFTKNLHHHCDVFEAKLFHSKITNSYYRSEVYDGIYVINCLSVDSNLSFCLQDWILRDGLRLLLKHYLRIAENNYRKSQGIETVENSLIWKSENELYQLISTSFPDEVIVQQATPIWLVDQRFDIYFPKRNIAIEYQGRQHYEAVDFFGGDEGLKKTKERDRKKRERCRKNGCKLLLVDEGYRFEEVKEKLKLLFLKTDKEYIVDYKEVKTPKHNDFEPIRITSNMLIYDCKDQIEIKLSELKKIYPNLKAETFKNRNSYLKRYILPNSKDGAKIKESWKTILDTYTGEKYRFNRIEFAEFLNVPSNNVWSFFSGKQKLFFKRYRIIK